MLLIRFFVLSNPPTHGVEVGMFVVEKFAPKMLSPPLSLVDFYYYAQNIQACSNKSNTIEHCSMQGATCWPRW